MNHFKAFIRVVKSLNKESEDYIKFGFDSVTIIHEKNILAEDSKEVKSILLDKYPQFFPNKKVYSRETKDDAQFFYVVIYPLFNSEVELVKRGVWKCQYCDHEHPNKYESKPYYNSRLFGSEVLFCGTEGNICFEAYKKKEFENMVLPEDQRHINDNSPIFIYKITEKSTGKCYIGKTKNAPFFRWWNHLTKSSSPFGLYLSKSKLSDWTFEVITELPCNTEESEVLLAESKYIIQYDSLKNGFNTVISNKKAIN